MSAVQLDLNRIHISLQGSAVDLVREALDGLEDEISRQLQGTKIANDILSINGVSLKPITLPAAANAAQLRALLVQQIVFAVRQGTASSSSAPRGISS
jgi:hypothetical protein